MRSRSPVDAMSARSPRLAARFESVGAFGGFLLRVAADAARKGPDASAVAAQIEAMGIRSLSVAALTAVFSCMVMAVQFTFQMARFGAQDYVGQVVAVSQVRELGPVLTALIAGGRIGAGITAELGAMRVTEQVDAMRSMGADPIRTLVLPRALAGAVVLPVLTIIADVAGIAAAMVMARLQSAVGMAGFYRSSLRVVTTGDVVGGLVKAGLFGALIALTACHLGLRAAGGTQGVGRATTRTVVIVAIATLVSDFAFTKVLMLWGV